MNNEPFDSKLKSRLDESVSEVPEHLWAAVEAKLMTPPRRRFPFYFIIGTILVLSGMAYIGWQKTEAIQQAMTQEIVPKTKTGQPLLAHSPEQINASAESITSLPTLEADDNNSVPNLMIDQPDGQEKTEAAVGKREDANKELFTGNNKDSRSGIFFKNAGIRQVNSKKEKDVDGSLLSSFAAQKFLATGLITPILSSAFTHGGKNQQMVFPLPDKPMSSIACPSVNGPGRRQGWYVEPYGGIFLPVSQTNYKTAMMPNNDTVSSSLVPQPSFQAGFMVGTYIAPGKSLKAGLQYSRWNEQFRYSNLSERQTTTTITIRTVYLSNGDSLRVQDTTIAEQLGRRTVRTNNRLQSIEVPVIVGFEWGNHTRWSANMGIIASIRSAYEGSMADSLNKPIPIDEGLYRQSIGIGIHAGLGLMQPVGERLQFILEPNVRINLANEATNNAWFRQRRMMGGINAGLRYRLR